MLQAFVKSTETWLAIAALPPFPAIIILEFFFFTFLINLTNFKKFNLFSDWRRCNKSKLYFLTKILLI